MRWRSVLAERVGGIWQRFSDVYPAGHISFVTTGHRVVLLIAIKLTYSLEIYVTVSCGGIAEIRPIHPVDPSGGSVCER